MKSRQSSIRIVIADDHPVLRDGLITVLTHHPQLVVVGQAASFSAVHQICAGETVNVVVLDINGMQGSPLACIERLGREQPHIGIVVFSSDLSLAPELLRAGALGYVLKEEPSARLVESVIAAARGDSLISATVAEHIEYRQAAADKVILTEREWMILGLLAKGHSTQEIADQLVIDARTAQNYITKIRSKTGCENRVQLVAWHQRMVGTL